MTAPRRQLQVAEHEIEAALQLVGLARALVRSRQRPTSVVRNAQDQVVLHRFCKRASRIDDSLRQVIPLESTPVYDEAGKTDGDRVGIHDEPVDNTVLGIQLVHVDLGSIQMLYPLQSKQHDDPEHDRFQGGIGADADMSCVWVVVLRQARASIKGPHEYQVGCRGVDLVEVPSDFVEPLFGKGVPGYGQHRLRRVFVHAPHVRRHRVHVLNQRALVRDQLGPRQLMTRQVLQDNERQQRDENDDHFEPPPADETIQG